MAKRLHYIIGSMDDYRDSVRERLESALQAFCRQETAPCILALNEAVNNAFFHGNRSGPVIVTISLIGRKKVAVRVKDSGAGFDFSLYRRETEDGLWEGSGRGMLLMRSFMDQVIYNHVGNEVLMIKNVAKG